MIFLGIVIKAKCNRGRWEGTEENWGRRKHNQNILHEKLFSQ